MNQPWLIEPDTAQKWAMIALDLLQPQGAASPISKWADEQSQPYTKNGVFVLPVNGPLMKYENCGSPGTSNMLESFRQAQADPSIEAIVLQVDSPGGTVDGTKVFADAIKASTKPVVTFVDGLMASAAAWIGTSATEVIASTGHDMVGSIGTMIQWADFTEAYKQRGIKLHTAYASDSTDKNRLLSNASESGNYTELITTMLDPVNSEFTGAVKANRSGKINLENENVLTGKTYMAKDAIKHGLVDKIGSLDFAIKRAKALASAKQKQMETTATAFQNTLAAAKAPAFEVVEELGFGLTEENLNNIEAALVENAATIASINGGLTALQAQVDQLTSQLAEANNELNNVTAQREALTAQVVKMGGQPAHIQPDPAASADPVKVINEADQFLTSADAEKAAMRKKFNL